MNAVVYLLLLTVGSATGSTSYEDPNEPIDTVLVSLGPSQKLRGLSESSSAGDSVYKFYGIPYALPPVGDLRFQPPQPASDWTGVKDAVSKSAICLQMTYEDFTSKRSEDCLYLNVFTPDVNASLPVLVWIHGGGYRTGSAWNDGDGATMAPHGIVAVTINYRLGPFGFMSTGDDVMPGNYGMLDQVLALKWVQKYISAFGGDPKQVTIGGESAGAFSVSLNVVSPLTKGLFKRAIMESGSALSMGAIERASARMKVRDSTLRSADRVGCNKTTSAEVLKCLQAVNADLLLNVSQDASLDPRIESKFGFLPDYPSKLIEKGNYNKVDTLQGTNSGEMSGVIQDPENDGITKQYFEDSVKARFAGSINAPEIASELINDYLGDETDPIMLRSILVQAVKDSIFGAATLLEICKYANASDGATKHYLYEFSYRMSGTTSPAWRGVEHAAERRFVFYPDARFKYSTASDRMVGERVQTMWTNFIKYGDPTPANIHNADSQLKLVTWEAFGQNNYTMLEIGAESQLVTYPRMFLIPLYQEILDLADTKPEDVTIVG